jgi:hypothetical protein
MATDATRGTTFEDGAKFIDHITSIDALYTAVMADIAKSSFKVAGWKIDQATKFEADFIHVPGSTAGGEMPKWLISRFDETPDLNPAQGNTLDEVLLEPKRQEVSNLQYAWDGDDQLAYIDGVASAVFLQ